jgi:hypothetical protein
MRYQERGSGAPKKRWPGRPAARLPGALLAIAAAIAALTLPPAASAASRAAPPATLSTLELPSPGGPFPDSLITGRARHLSRLSRSSDGQSYPVIGGEQVQVSSTYYSSAELQGVVNVLGGLVHGPEMSLLSVYVASPAEITDICGPGALACYAPGVSEMVVSGTDTSHYGIPRDYTIAHEYGHHIANNRLNSPWVALDTGAKRWATYEHVCQAVHKGQLFPGDEGSHYWQNPGEGFAESNAHLNFPGVQVPWGYSPLLQPTQGSLAKVYEDITDPWSGPDTVTWNGSLRPGRHKPAVRRFSTPLDGQVEIELSGPAGSNFDLYVLGPKLQRDRPGKKRHRTARSRRHIIERAVSGGSSEQVETTVCGQSSLRVEVRRRSGSGPFSVTLTRP